MSIRQGRTMSWMMILSIALVAIVGAAGPAGASEIHRVYTFSEPQIESVGEFHRVTLPGAWSYGDPGAPVLPMAGVQLLLPPGETIVSVEIIPGEQVRLPGWYRVEPGQPQVPLSTTGPLERERPDPILYASAEPFPGRQHDAARLGFLRGHGIASFALHPVEYRPADGALSYVRSMEVVIRTAPDASAQSACQRMGRADARTRARLARLVDNPEALDRYAQIPPGERGSRQLDPALGYTYLIITGDDWAPYLDELAAFESARGHKAGVFLKSWILANYTGNVDEAANLRDFVIDAYQTWGVDYLLLVGDARDAQGIPHRGLYSNTAYMTSDSDIPADLYYGALDGSWNDDGDANWGEPGEDDLYVEVGVGRACIDSPTEIQNFVTKAIRYQSNPVVAECDEALMVGELLWDDPTWGGDYKDEIKDGASTYGYTTVGFPASMNVGTLYDREGTWSTSQLIGLMEGGLNLVNHLGHCNVTYAMKMYVSDIPSFDNDGLTHSYNFVYSQGCYGGSMDNRNDYGGYESDCFAEQFTSDDAGAVAVVMNSRYGWGEHESTNGSSQYYDREFFDALFGEAIWPLADINDDSRMDNIWALDYGANRWCYYELNVFGDPAMHLWTAEPGPLVVDHPSVVFLGVPGMDVTVSAGGGPVANARVTIHTADGLVYDTGLTDGFGQVTLHPNATVPGTLEVVVTAHDALPYAGQATLTPPDGPYLTFAGVTVLDAGGDDDGELDAGETAGLAIALENVGIAEATTVSATLATADPAVTITIPQNSFPDIAAGATEISLAAFGLEVSGTTPDQHVIPFTLTAVGDQGSWQATFTLTVQAPVLTAGAILVTDMLPPGNGNGGADPGETVLLQVWLENLGHAPAETLSGQLTTTEAHALILDEEGECAAVLVGEAGLLGTYEVEILSSCPSPSTLDFTLAISGAHGYEASVDLTLDVGGWFDDAEEDRGWTLGAPDDDAATGRWVRAEPVGTADAGQQIQPEEDHTPDPGELCFVTANAEAGASVGAADVDDGKTTLLTPVFDLGDATEATVSYWRWYTNDLGNNPGEDWWDVDLTADGETWVHLEHTMESNNSWTQQTFALHEVITLSNQVRLRFVAADESPGSLVEAAVDDFLLSAVRVSAADLPAPVVRATFGIVACGPNPARDRTAIAYRVGRDTEAELAVYDLNGRKVRTLVAGRVSAGQHPVSFDGRDGVGRRLPSGIYFLRLETPELLEVRQITLLR